MARLSYIVTIIGIALMCVVAQEELYNDQHDYINAASILQNDKLRDEFYGCLMETSSCMSEAQKFIKDVLFEALRTQCKRCTEKQKTNINSIVDWYTKNKPDEWEALIAKSKM